MATAQQFEDLHVWQDARALVDSVYTASKQRDFYHDLGLREQIRRATVSAMSNIAEGFERDTRKEFIQFLSIAKGSVGEARSQLYIALDQEYLNQTKFDELKELAVTLSRRIATFIAYLEKYQNNSRIRKPTKR